MATILNKKWRDLSTYKKTQGITLFNALGIRGATYPSLQPELTQTYSKSPAASLGASAAGGGGTGTLGKGVGSGSSGTSPGGSAPPGSATGVNPPGANNGCDATTTQNNQALGQKMAAQMGWTGSEWADLNTLMMHESGWCNVAANPSGAYGIGQFMPYTWPGFGPKTSDPTLQIKYMLEYIKQRYGSPSAAWAQYFNHPGGQGSY